MGRKDSADGVKKDRTVQSAGVFVPEVVAGVGVVDGVEIEVGANDRGTESLTDPEPELEPEPEQDADPVTDDAGPDLVTLAGSHTLGLALCPLVARDGLRRNFGGRCLSLWIVPEPTRLDSPGFF